MMYTAREYFDDCVFDDCRVEDVEDGWILPDETVLTTKSGLFCQTSA